MASNFKDVSDFFYLERRQHADALISCILCGQHLLLFLLGWWTGDAEMERRLTSSFTGNDAGFDCSCEKRGFITRFLL